MCVRVCVMFTDTLQLIGCWVAAVDPSLSGVSLYSCTHPKSIDADKCEHTQMHTHTFHFVYVRSCFLFKNPAVKPNFNVFLNQNRTPEPDRFQSTAYTHTH